MEPKEMAIKAPNTRFPRRLVLTVFYLMGIIGIVASGGGGGGGGDDSPTTASISVDPITADDIVDILEAVGIINVTGSVGGAAGPGAIVNFAVNGNPYNGTVGAGSTFSIAVDGLDLAADTSFVAAVTGITTAGESYAASTTSTHTVDLPTDATISVDPITADDIVNAAEAAGAIDVTGTVGGWAESGDSVDFTVNGQPYNGIVGGANTFSISVNGVDLAADNSFDATVSGTDIFGNPFSGITTSAHTVDTTASATITVDNITADDIVDDAEASGNIDVTGSVGGDAEPGDTVSFNVHISSYSGLVLAGNVFSIQVSGYDLHNDTSFDVTVEGTDAAGNPFSETTTSTHTIDTLAPATPSSPILDFDIKTFSFTWIDVLDATFYRLLENPDGLSGYVQVGSDITQGTQVYDHVVPLYKRFDARYILQSCNVNGCTDSSPIFISGALIEAIGYFKAGNSGENDWYGVSVSLSDDGSTMAVGAYQESSSTDGINTVPDDLAPEAGAVYVFSKSGGTWTQEAYIKASDSQAEDQFGTSVSLSDDGNTLAVGAPTKFSIPGIDRVYIYIRNGGIWSEEALIVRSPIDTLFFGYAVSLSGDGNTLAVGDPEYILRQFPRSTSGAVFIYSRNGSVWSAQASSISTEEDDNYGLSVSLSDDGDTLAIGAPSGFLDRGSVYIFSRSGVTWTEQTRIFASNPGLDDSFGGQVSLSGNASTLAVGARNEDSSTTGVNTTPDNLADNSGAVYIYTGSGSNWSEQAYLKASNTDIADGFGFSVSLSDDGNTLAIGALREDSNSTGINGSQTDNSVSWSGAGYVFTRSGVMWSQQAYVKASNTGSDDGFSNSISLSGDGNTLAVGAWAEDSNATGIDGNQTDNSSSASGAVYLY